MTGSASLVTPSKIKNGTTEPAHRKSFPKVPFETETGSLVACVGVASGLRDVGSLDYRNHSGRWGVRARWFSDRGRQARVVPTFRPARSRIRIDPGRPATALETARERTAVSDKLLEPGGSRPCHASPAGHFCICRLRLLQPQPSAS